MYYNKVIIVVNLPTHILCNYTCIVTIITNKTTVLKQP